MESLGELLRKTLHDLGIEKPIQQFDALRVWPRAVGPRIASVTEPRHVADGKLFIKVKNAAWRNELVFQKRALIDNVNRELGQPTIRDIVLI